MVHPHHIHGPLQRECSSRYRKAQPGVPLAGFHGQRRRLEREEPPFQKVGGPRSPGRRPGHRRRQQPRHQHHAHRAGPQQAPGVGVAGAVPQRAGAERAKRRGRGGGSGDGGGGAGGSAADRPRRGHRRVSAEIQEEGREGGMEGGGTGGGQRLHQHRAHVGGADAGLPQQLRGLRGGRVEDVGRFLKYGFFF